MESNKLVPGAEVVLASGAVGVLYAKTWPARRRRVEAEPDCWYFLPDTRGTAGLVVFGQPCEISESQVDEVRPVREGVWPHPGRRLSGIERQLVYVAHMKHRQLPVLDAASAGA